MSSSHPDPSQGGRRRPRPSSTSSRSSIATTVAASAAAAYGAYRLGQWYFKQRQPQQEHDENRNTPPPTEGNLPLSSSSLSSSWLSAATEWLVDAAMSKDTITVDDSTWNNNNRGPQRQPNPPSQSPTNNLRSTIRPNYNRHRRQRLLQCRKKTLVAFDACLPALQPILEDLTTVSQATKQLKELRKQNQRQQQKEDELWTHIVVETTTRMMASSYAYTLLFLSLTVQLHWIGANRNKLRSSSVDDDDDVDDSAEIAQAMLMQSHQYVTEEGLPLLVSAVRRSVEAVLTLPSDQQDNRTAIDWTKPTQFLMPDDIQEVLHRQLPRVLKYGSSGGVRSTTRNWIRYILPDEEHFDPIWDICSSPVWEDAQEQVLETLWFQFFRDDDTNGWKQLFSVQTSNELQQQERQQPSPQPVARIVAQFKKSSNLLFMDRNGDSNQKLANQLEKLPTVMELGDVSFQQGENLCY